VEDSPLILLQTLKACQEQNGSVTYWYYIIDYDDKSAEQIAVITKN